MKILMVCLGNICRSPLAEGLMKKHISAKGFQAIIDSAGTGNWHSGEAPDHRSVQVAKINGIDISQQRARQLKTSDFDEFDILFTMDESIHNDVRKLTSDQKHLDKVHLLRVYAGHNESLVPDPYYEDLEAFKAVYKLLDETCQQAAARIIENAGKDKKL